MDKIESNIDKLTGNYFNDVSFLNEILRIDCSFDMVKREIVSKSGIKCAFFYITGFADGQVVQDFFRYCIESDIKISDEMYLPFVEASKSNKIEDIIKNIMAGMVCLVCEGANFAYLMDMRKMPLRGIEEPENDKVLRGARDGFCEALQPNAALIRRRIRDPKLTFSVFTVGNSTKTDIALAFMDGIANKKYVENLKKQIENMKVDSLNFQGESIIETIIKKKWYNPFPKVRYTERPDAAAASLLEGSILLMCDNFPSVMILPTSIFDFFQETDDFSFPPLTGTYLRLIRFFVYVFSIYLTPVWLYSLSIMDKLPSWLKFLELSSESGIPVFWQLLIVEFAIDGMRLASLNTPDVLGSALSIVGGLILGDFAVTAGWFSPDVILYTAFVSIANFTQTSYELGYAVKFMRMIMLILTYLLGGYGILIGTILMLTLIVTNNSIDGSRSYLYPLIPFNFKALKSLMFRIKR